MSWIRKRDSHILTVGSSTFISDGRFHILKPEKRHVWTLRIRYAYLLLGISIAHPVNYKIGLTLTFFFLRLFNAQWSKWNQKCYIESTDVFQRKMDLLPSVIQCMYNSTNWIFFSPPYFLIGSDLTTRSIF